MFKLGDLVKIYCPEETDYHDSVGTVEIIDRESDFPFKVRLLDTDKHNPPIGFRLTELIRVNNKTLKITIRRKGGVSNETETS